jgi:hypothetical protein
VLREAGADWVLDNCGSLSFEGSSGDGILISIRE